MDSSLFVLDLPTWLPWTSDALYVGSFCLVLFALVLVSCTVVQILTPESHFDAPKKTTHLAPKFQVRRLLVRRSPAPGADFLRSIVKSRLELVKSKPTSGCNRSSPSGFSGANRSEITSEFGVPRK